MVEIEDVTALHPGREELVILGCAAGAPAPSLYLERAGVGYNSYDTVTDPRCE